MSISVELKLVDRSVTVCRIIQKYLSNNYKHCVSGYIRNNEKQTKGRRAPLQIMQLILINSFFYEVFNPMAKLIMSTNDKELESNILSDILQLLKLPNACDENLIKILDDSNIFLYYISNLIQHKNNDFNYYKKINCFLAFIQSCSTNPLLLIKYEAHKMYSNLLTNAASYGDIGMCLYVLAEIAANNMCHEILIRDCILDILHRIIIKMFRETKFSICLIESCGAAASLLQRLSESIYESSESNENRFCIMLLLLLKKTLLMKQTYFDIHEKKESHSNKCPFNELRLVFDNDIILPLSRSLFIITGTSEYACGYITQQLLPRITLNLTNTTMLQECLCLMQYQVQHVRTCIIKFFNNTLVRENIVIIDILIQNGIIDKFEKIITQNKYNVSDEEHINILLSISNLLSSNSSHRGLILSNQMIVSYIFSSLYDFQSPGAVQAALYCINNVLEMEEQIHIDCILHHLNGKIINATVSILNLIAINSPLSGYERHSDGKESLFNVVMQTIYDMVAIIQKDTSNKTNWMMAKMKSENLTGALKRLSLWRHVKGNIFCIEINFLEKIGLLKYQHCIAYLIETLIKKEQ